MQIVEPLLGTRAEVEVTAESAAVAEDLENRVLGEVRRLESVFTVFDPNSALHELRRTGSTSVPELAVVAALAAEWHDRSHGAFDPRTRSLMDLWDEGERSGTAPSPDALASALAVRDRAGQAFDDLNALAKGWIAQAALRLVATEEPGIESVWLSLGGDMVHRGVGSVLVGIEDPHRAYDNVAPMATVALSNEAVATSGGARRWWTIAGRRYPKVIDPRTGLPVERVASATVVATDGAVADVLATIATVVDVEQTLALADEVGAACLLVHPDRSRTVSSQRFVVA